MHLKYNKISSHKERNSQVVANKMTGRSSYRYGGVAAAAFVMASMLLSKNASSFAPTQVSICRQQSLSMQRREIIDVFTNAAFGAGVTAIIGSTQEANALDMDSFEKSLLDNDTAQCDPNLDRKCVPKLTPDEALCKYGVPGSDSRAAACRKVRDAGGLLPTSKKYERDVKGWVDNPIAL